MKSVHTLCVMTSKPNLEGDNRYIRRDDRPIIVTQRLHTHTHTHRKDAQTPHSPHETHPYRNPGHVSFCSRTRPHERVFLLCEATVMLLFFSSLEYLKGFNSTPARGPYPDKASLPIHSSLSGAFALRRDYRSWSISMDSQTQHDINNGRNERA